MKVSFENLYADLYRSWTWAESRERSLVSSCCFRHAGLWPEHFGVTVIHNVAVWGGKKAACVT